MSHHDDSYYDHTNEAPPQVAHGEKVNAPMVMLVGTGLFVLIAATIAVVYLFYLYHVGQRLEASERIGKEEAQLQQKAEWEARMAGGYAWVTDKDGLLVGEGSVQGPIEAGMQQIESSYSDDDG